MEITGRLTADAIVKTTKGNKQVVNFDLVVNHVHGSKENRKEETSYFHCSYWIGTNIAEILKQGYVVHVTGWLNATAYIAEKDGLPKASLNFHCDSIQVFKCGPVNRHEDAPAQNPSQPSQAEPCADQPDDDLPF